MLPRQAKAASLVFLFFSFACVCSRWQCYSSHHRTQRVCYSLLLSLLRSIDAEWDPIAVRGDLVGRAPSFPTQ